jgi:hypothetical protein
VRISWILLRNAMVAAAVKKIYSRQCCDNMFPPENFILNK